MPNFIELGLRLEAIGTARKKREIHGLYATRTYNSYRGMKGRCYNQKDQAYQWYGARGITVCERWRNSFLAFVADMGICPPGMGIDRIDNEGNYEPENCKWSTPAEQNENTRITVRLVFQGKVQTATQWSAETGIHRKAIKSRIRRGWTVRDALTIKARKRTV